MDVALESDASPVKTKTREDDLKVCPATQRLLVSYDHYCRLLALLMLLSVVAEL